jgi:hypothetical protein
MMKLQFNCVFFLFFLSANLMRAQTAFTPVKTGAIERFVNCVALPNGNYICAVIKRTAQGTMNSSLICFDKNGNLVFEKEYSKPASSLCLSKIAVTPAGEVLAFGCVKNTANGTSKTYGCLINATGDLAWENYYSESENESIVDFYTDANNDVYLCGTTKVRGEGSTDILLMKINQKGKKLWINNFGNQFINDRGQCLVFDNNSVFVFGKTINNVNNRPELFAAKVDARGNLVSKKSYSNTEIDSVFSRPTEAGGVRLYYHIKNDQGTFTTFASDLERNSLELLQTKNLYTGAGVASDMTANLCLLKTSEGDERLFLTEDSKTHYSGPGTVNRHSLLLKDNNVFVFNYSQVESSGLIDLLKFDKVVKAESMLKVNFTQTVEKQEAREEEGDVTMRGSDPFKGTNIANTTKEIKVGRYYAFIIGVDGYSGSWSPLKNAVNDAKAVESTLRSKYRMDVFKTLYNSEATRNNIIAEFEWLVKNVKENDNVLIFYSGHGEFNKDLNKGFWVPIDSKGQSTSAFISNNDIQTYLAAIKSKHTLLISDACFSGDILRGNTTSIPYEKTEKYYSSAYNARSCQALTSGGIEPVMDGGKDGHSIFTYYLLKALETNESKYFDAGQLYNKVKLPVANNSDQSPSFNPIKNAFDEGGQFIFIKK